MEDTVGEAHTEFTEQSRSREHNANQFLDLVPGSAGSDPSYMRVHNGYLYFGSSGIDNSWMVLPSKRDRCDSFRQSSFDTKVFFAVSDSTTWNPKRRYDCPLGYHWATTEEGHRHFTTMRMDTEVSLCEYGDSLSGLSGLSGEGLFMLDARRAYPCSAVACHIVIFPIEWFIRKPYSSSIIPYNNTSIAYKNHTNKCTYISNTQILILNQHSMPTGTSMA